MPKLTLPLSQVHELSVIRDAEGVCVSIPEFATAFMQAMNLVSELASIDLSEAMTKPMTIIHDLKDRAKAIKAMVQK